MPAVYEYRCRRCRQERTPPVEGPCPSCAGFYRTIKRRVRGDDDEDSGLPEGPVPVGDLLNQEDCDQATDKQRTGLSGVDYVFGGGIPRFGTILFCAMEGVGKTTWLFELFLRLVSRSLFLSSEQEKDDLIREFSRLGAERIQKASRHMFVESATEMDRIVGFVESQKPKLFALDSLHDIEEIYDEHGKLMSCGSNRAVTRAAKIIRKLSRRLGCFSFLVGHMANDGTMMGGSHLRHAVDGVLGLYRVRDDDKDPRRILRFKGKCRFAPIGREALFKMTDSGLKDCGPFIKQEKDPKPTGGPPKLRLVKES